MSVHVRPMAIGLALLFTLFAARTSFAQITTGTVAGIIRDREGVPAQTMLIVSSELGFRVEVRTDAHGAFLFTLPYGRYALTVEHQHVPSSPPVTIDVEPLQNQQIKLIIDNSGNLRLETEPSDNPGVWDYSPDQALEPQPFNFAGLMLSSEPSTATQPMNFVGLGDNRLAWQSPRGVSWTGMQFKFMGMDTTESFQPGRPAILPNVKSIEQMVARSGFAQTTSNAYASEVGFFTSQPLSSWHGDFSTTDTAAAFASNNLPPPAERGIVRQTERYRWLTRDSVETGGAVTKLADVFLAAAGDWSSQTVPIASPGNDLASRMLFADSRLRIQAGPRDQFDLLYSGSRLDLFSWAMPAGLEVLTGQRMAPSLTSPYGFQNESEADRFSVFQAGWSHIAPDEMLGALQARYQYSTARFDTTPLNELSQTRIELLGGDVTGAAPLANLARETRQQANASWQPLAFLAENSRHRVVIGFGFETSSPSNHFTMPSDMNLITAAGAAALAVEFNTPAGSRSTIRTSTLTLADHVVLGESVSLDLGAVVDFARGSLPPQSSPAGTFAPSRILPAHSDLIAWNSISPRAGFAWTVPHGGGLVLRATYFRVDVPMAGRYLDFGNSNSLGGSGYQWIDRNGDGIFEAGELGALVLHLGGPYSSISPSLARPYADEFDVGAEIRPSRALDLRITLFRRDDKRRIAAVNTGVPPSAFSPVTILDPGPDGITGTFDDQQLTAYQQNPATFGQDHYLLTNPPDLRNLDKGLQAEVHATWRNLFIKASFVAEESYGPANPGDSVSENDPGVVGALYADPNTLVNAGGRGVMDRAYLGKLSGAYRVPWGGIEVAAIADYLDGLVFARQLLITGLAQGPIVIDATSRGTQLFNPLSGNRAEGVINANLRLARRFSVSAGTFEAALELMNVANSGYKIQENEISGRSFNLRQPVEIQPARFVRFQLRYTF